MSRAPRIAVDPVRPLIDERFAVRLAGFPPGCRVTVRARMPLDGHLWEARAVVRTGPDGTVDLDETSPLAGTYGRADAMGLVWSARPVGGRPAVDGHTATDGNVSLTAAVGGRTVATATVERRFAADGVTRRDVGEAGLAARLYEPPGDGPHPGVLLLGGASGGYPSGRAASLLASRGYAVLALAYFGVESRPANLVEIPLEYVDTAVEWLADRVAVREAPLGVVGWSRGGELALLAATRQSRVRTAVAYVASTVVFQGTALLSDPGSAWTADGAPHPYVPTAATPGFALRAAGAWLRGHPLAVRPLFERGLRTVGEETLAAATIPVEDIGGPILLVTGDDDRVLPADTLATRALARLDARGYEHPYEHLLCPGAGHDIKVPYHPTTERAVRSLSLPGRPLRWDMGGTPAGYADADARAWRRTLATLDAGLRE